MDPYGNYDCFLVQPRNRPPYRVEEIARLLPYKLRIERSFMGHHVQPLTLPLMKRVDCRDSGLALFDLIALIDISPGVFELADIRILQSYVETGGSLLLFGGQYSLGNSLTAYTGWEGILPVGIQTDTRTFDKPVKPVLKKDFAKLTGDLGQFGPIRAIQVVKPQPGAVVLAEAGGMPLIVTRRLGKGRVMVIPAYPDAKAGAVRQGRFDQEEFFRSDGYANLLGACLSWCLGRGHDLQAVGLRAPKKVAHGTGATIGIRPKGFQAHKADLAVHRAGDELVLDRDPEFTDAVAAKAGAGKPGRHCAWRLAPSELTAGLYRGRVCVEGHDEGKDTYVYRERSYYGIKAPDHARNAKIMRIVTFDVAKKTGLRAYPVGFHNTVTPGSELAIAVERIGAVPRNTTLSASLHRRGSEEQIAVGDRDPVAGKVAYRIPNLQPDEYTLRLVARCSGRTLDTVRIPIVVVPPLREEEGGFCVVAQGAFGCTTRGMKEWFEEMAAGGFNCFRMHDVSRLTAHQQQETSHTSALESYWDELAQKNGFTMWGEYSTAVLLATHGWSGEEGSKATIPCPYTPAYRDAVRQFIRDLMDAARYLPRLISMEIKDEPHLYPPNVDHSPEAREHYRRQYGVAKPSWAEYLAFRDRRRMDYFHSVIDYAARCFKVSYEEVNAYLREKGQSFPRIHHVYAQGAIHNPAVAVFDQLEWSRHCHSVEFDSYPWIFANFRAWDKLRMAEPRYMFAYYRTLCDHLHKPIGFFVDTSDEYYPHEIWPLNTASELLYLAAGIGAKQFHTMFISFMGMQNPRYEKEQQFCKDLRKIMDIAPLLAVTRPVRTGLGALNAWAHRLYNPPEHRLPEGFEGLGFYSLRSRPLDTIVPNWVEPQNGFEAIYRAYGTLPDVVDERILPTELPKYKAFTLLGAIRTMLPESFDLLWKFVHDGGLLIADGLPWETTDGKTDERFRRLRPRVWQSLAPGLRVGQVRAGKGRILLLDGELHDLMSMSYEQDKPVLREQLVAAIAAFLDAGGVAAEAGSSRPEAIGVYETRTDTTRVLTVINHAETAMDAVIVVRPVAGIPAPKWLFDFTAQRTVEFTRTGRTVRFDVRLASREALIVGVYPDVPQRSVLRVTPKVKASQPWAWEFRIANAAGAPARGDYPVQVKVYCPSGRRMKCFERSVPAIDGALKGEFVMPINPEKGTWKITGYNTLTFEELAATFQVV